MSPSEKSIKVSVSEFIMIAEIPTLVMMYGSFSRDAINPVVIMAVQQVWDCPFVGKFSDSTAMNIGLQKKMMA